MKKLLLGAMLLFPLSSCLAGGLPDPDCCIVLPQDNLESPRIVGIPAQDAGSVHAQIDIWVYAYPGTPIPNAYVELRIDPACPGLCVCDGAALDGVTDGSGHVRLSAQLGGCCEGTWIAEIRANGVTIRVYEFLVSPDYAGGQGGDCAVALIDFTVFATALLGGATGCSDYSGDGITTVADFVVFGDAWGRTCTPEP